MTKPQNIILCGFMGTGKTTVGKILAMTLGWAFVDTDEVIEDREGCTIAQIFAERGEPAFRALEHALCLEMQTWRHMVISTGGGIAVNPENRANMKQAGLVFCLDASAEEIVARLAGFTNRPLLAGDDPAQRIRQLLNSRAEAYAALPYHVNTTGATPETVAVSILNTWRQVKDAG